LETTIDQVRKRLRLLVDLMNKNEKAKSRLIAWIDGYDGKIIEFQVDNSSFYMVFTKENARLEEGSYPSPDAVIVTEPKFLIDILSGKVRLSSSLIAEDKLRVWGNFHEVVLFSKIVSSL